mgnify:CR=1 FL=1
MLNLQDTLKSAVVKLSEGNPGALRVCLELMQGSLEGFSSLLDADDMGLKGPAIWIGYKDFAKEDINVFREALRNRSQEMIAVIRREGYKAYEYGQS